MIPEKLLTNLIKTAADGRDDLARQSAKNMFSNNFFFACMRGYFAQGSIKGLKSDNESLFSRFIVENMLGYMKVTRKFAHLTP